MNTNLLHAINALITDDVESSSEYIRQVLVQKLRTKMGLNEASDCIEQLKTLLNDSGKKKQFLNAVTEIFNLSLQGDLEEFSDSLSEYDSKQIKKIYDSLEDESCLDDCFDELADKVITDAEQPDLYDVEIPEEFKSCLAQVKPNELQEILDEYKTEIRSLYSKSKTAKLYADVTDEFSNALNDD